MSLADIREQIKPILSGVAGIGMVHDSEKFAGDWKRYIDLFKDTESGRINGCAFRRETREETQTTLGETEVAHVFVIRRYMSIKVADDTGIIFEDTDELMVAAFKASKAIKTLNGTCRTIDPDWGPMSGKVGVQISVTEPRMFGGVLCHYSESRLCALEVIETTDI
jgi:hypothetical protein